MKGVYEEIIGRPVLLNRNQIQIEGRVYGFTGFRWVAKRFNTHDLNEINRRLSQKDWKVLIDGGIVLNVVSTIHRQVPLEDIIREFLVSLRERGLRVYKEKRMPFKTHIIYKAILDLPYQARGKDIYFGFVLDTGNNLGYRAVKVLPMFTVKECMNDYIVAEKFRVIHEITKEGIHPFDLVKESIKAALDYFPAIKRALEMAMNESIPVEQIISYLNTKRMPKKLKEVLIARVKGLKELNLFEFTQMLTTRAKEYGKTTRLSLEREAGRILMVRRVGD